MTISELARIVLNARARADDARKAAREAAAAAEQADDALLTAFAEAGVSSVTVDGMRISTASTVWARISPEVPPEDALSWLEAVGWGGCASRRVNVQILSALVRERRDDGAAMPEGFEQFIVINEKPGLRVARAR